MLQGLVRKLTDLKDRCGAFGVWSFEDQTDFQVDWTSTLEDPLAQRVAWTPLARGGSSFRTHRIARTDSTRLQFGPTAGLILFPFVLFGAGILVIVQLGLPVVASGKFSPTAFHLLAVLLGPLFVIAGAAALFSCTAPLVFDKQEGFFWKGRRSPDRAGGKGIIKHAAELGKIHALQILAKRTRTDNHSYRSYELNLVLEDGVRIGVLDHSSLQRLREDAKAVSAFLNKPVWDATLTYAPSEFPRDDWGSG